MAVVVSVPHRPSWQLHYDFSQGRAGERRVRGRRAASGASEPCSTSCFAPPQQRSAAVAEHAEITSTISRQIIFFSSTYSYNYS